jgi:hypothetical protein
VIFPTSPQSITVKNLTFDYIQSSIESMMNFQTKGVTLYFQNVVVKNTRVREFIKASQIDSAYFTQGLILQNVSTAFLTDLTKGILSFDTVTGTLSIDALTMTSCNILNNAAMLINYA